MSVDRIEEAIARIDAAMGRIASARPASETDTGTADRGTGPSTTEPDDGKNSARVLALINEHEKLRDEVSDTIGELDALIEELEG